MQSRTGYGLCQGAAGAKGVYQCYTPWIGGGLIAGIPAITKPDHIADTMSGRIHQPQAWRGFQGTIMLTAHNYDAETAGFLGYPSGIRV